MTQASEPANPPNPAAAPGNAPAAEPVTATTAPPPVVAQEAPAPAASTPAPEPNPMAAMAEQVGALSKELEAWKDRYLRLRADFDNYRKRASRDLSDARIQGTSNAVNQLLPVLDQMQLAGQTIESAQDMTSVKQGFTMISAEFQRCLDGLGVERIPTSGQAFNPALHEAIAAEHSAEVPEGQVLREWKAGFKVGERVMRVASVIVSKGPAGA